MNYLPASRFDQYKAHADQRKKLTALDLDRIHSEIHADVLQHAKICYSPSFKPEFFCRINADFQFSFVNDAFMNFYDLPQEKIIGRSLFSILEKKHCDRIRSILSVLNPIQSVCTCEYMFHVRDDNIRWRQWTVQAKFDLRGGLMEYECIGRDITEQKEAEAELLYRLTIEDAVAGVSKLLIGPQDPDIDHVLRIMGQVLAVNRSYILELTRDGRRVMNTFEWCDENSNSRIEYLQDLVIEHFPWGINQLNADGIIAISDVSMLPDHACAEKKILDLKHVKALLMVPFRTTKGKVLGYLGLDDTETSRIWTSEDIQCVTVVGEMLGAFFERKEFEMALKTSEEKFRTLTDTAPAVIFVWAQEDEENPLVYLNPSFERISGYDIKECLNLNFWNMVHEDCRAMTKERGKSRLRGETVPDRYEVKFQTKYGIGWGVLSASPVMWEGKPAIMGVINDISEQKKIEEELCKAQDKLELRVKERTAELVVLNQKLQQEIAERKQAEQELKNSMDNFRKLAENSPALIYVFNKNRLLYINSTALSMAGYTVEEIPDVNPWAFIHPDCQKQVRKELNRRFRGESILPSETRLVGKNGQEIIGFMSADLIDYEGETAILGIIVDVTQRKKMEEELIQASKMESLGILAGGIAHDFNNILTIISGNISLAKLIMEQDHEIREILHEVDQATLQARDLTQQLLTFSKGGAPIKEAASVQELLKESASFVLRGSNVNCKFAIPDDLWTVVIDKGQFNQVINNLIINADQAMPEGGTIRLAAENIRLNCDNSLFGKANPFIKISIADQGVGIAEDQVNKIFEPYFTTKQNGHGLGLPTCYSIIKKHGGDIKVSSELGLGTTIDIYLPACPELRVEKKNSGSIPLHGQGRILVMDDDVLVRETLGKMLSILGYQPVFAADGFEAIGLYQQNKANGQPCNAVIMDLTIAGGMGGKKAVKKLLELDAEAKVIVSSGYSNDPVLADFKRYGFCGVIPKPYEIEKLNEVLLNAGADHLSVLF